MFKDQGDRHYWFADNLIKSANNITVFCAATVHISIENIDTGTYVGVPLRGI